MREKKLITIILIAMSISVNANWFTDAYNYFFGPSKAEINYFKVGRTLKVGTTLRYDFSKFRIGMQGTPVIQKIEGHAKLFRSTWTGLCGLKGKQRVSGKGSHQLDAFNRNENNPIEERHCYYLDLASYIKANVGSCPSRRIVEKEEGNQKSTLSLSSDCQCTRTYEAEKEIPRQDPNSRVLYYTNTFVPYKVKIKNFVDFSKCERFFENKPDQLSEIKYILRTYSHFNDPKFQRSRANGGSQYFNILTGERKGWW